MAQETKEKAIKKFNFYNVSEDSTSPFGKIQTELEKLEMEEADLKSKLELIHPRMQFLHDKARMLYDVFKSLAAGLVIQPYDAALLASVKSSLKGWALLKTESSDQAIRDLFKTCRDYRHYTTGEFTRGYHGEIFFWMHAKLNQSPTLKNDELIAEIRRVLGIEKPKQPAKPAAKSKTVGEPTKKIEKKVAKSPAAPGVKTFNQWLAGTKASANGRKLKNVDWEDPFWKDQHEKAFTAEQAVDNWEVQPRLFDSKQPAKAPPKAETPKNGKPLPGFRKQTLGQFMSTVRGVLLGKTNIQIDDKAPYWQKALDEGKRPSDAAREWLQIETSKDAIAKDPKTGGPGAAPPMKSQGPRPLSEPNPDGPFFSPAKLGITEAVLNNAISLELRPEGEDAFLGAKISQPVHTKQGMYAVVHLNERSGHLVYHLQPIEGAAGKRKEEWRTRWEAHPDKDVTDIPLAGVCCIDDIGIDYVFGPDDKRIYVEVPRVKSAV